MKALLTYKLYSRMTRLCLIISMSKKWSKQPIEELDIGFIN